MDHSREMLAYLVQCVVESHVGDDEQHSRRVEKVQYEIEQMGNQAFGGKLRNLYQMLFPEPNTEIGSLLLEQSEQLTLEVYFWVENKTTGRKMLGEGWKIYLQELAYSYHANSNFSMTIQLFSQLLLFLKNQSFLKEQQIKTHLSSPHIINYQIYTSDTLRTINKPHKYHEMLSIHSLPSKYSIQRLCPSFFIQIQCYSQPNILKLETILSSMSSKKDKNHLSETKTEEQSTKKTGEQQLSLFLIYQQSSDFTILSPSNSSFTISPKDSVMEVKLEKGLVESEEFQILTPSKDDQFIEKNQNLFKQLKL